MRSVLKAGGVISFRLSGWRRAAMVRCSREELIDQVVACLQRFTWFECQFWEEDLEVFGAASKGQAVTQDVRNIAAFELWVKFATNGSKDQIKEEAESIRT